MPSPNRRLFLGTLGATLTSIAGCLGQTPAATDGTPAETTDPESATESPPIDTTTATTESPESFSLPDAVVKTVGGVQVAVANATVEKAVSYQSVMGSSGVLAPKNGQFVVAEVQSDPRRGSRPDVRRLRNRRPDNGSLHHLAGGTG